MDKILDLSLIEVADKIKSGELTSEQVTKECLKQIATTKDINALISSAEMDKIVGECKDADIKANRGSKLPLLGVPVVVKDNISTLDYETTCASKFLKGYKAP